MRGIANRLVLLSLGSLIGSVCMDGPRLVVQSPRDGGSGADGDAGPSGPALDGKQFTERATASTCSLLPANPTIAFTRTCSAFVPPLANTEIVFVDQTITGPPGNRVVAQRFRATASCGFEVVFSLPNLELAVDSQPYQMSQWWLQSGGRLEILVAVLRRSFSGPVLLAVAAPESADKLNLLVSPLAVTLHGPVCTDPAQAGSTSQVLESKGAPLRCEDEDRESSLRLCHDGDSAYRMIAYRGAPDSTAVPIVFGASDLLLTID